MSGPRARLEGRKRKCPSEGEAAVPLKDSRGQMPMGQAGTAGAITRYMGLSRHRQRRAQGLPVLAVILQHAALSGAHGPNNQLSAFPSPFQH